MKNTKDLRSTSGTLPRQGKIKKICDKEKQQRRNARGSSVRNKRFALKDALKRRKGRLRQKSGERSLKSVKKSELRRRKPLLLPPLLRKRQKKSLSQSHRLTNPNL